jgi:hypothetical protein
MTGTDLDTRDFYSRTQDQARRLRGLAGDNRLDTEHPAEEVADLGRSEHNTVRQQLDADRLWRRALRQANQTLEEYGDSGGAGRLGGAFRPRCAA